MPNLPSTDAPFKGSPKRGAWAAAVALLVSPPIAVAGGLAMAPVAALAGFVGAPYRRAGVLLRKGGLPVMLLALFVLWAVLGAVWSGASSRWEAAAKLFFGIATGLGLLAGVLIADRDAKSIVRAATAGSALMLCVLLTVETLCGMPFNRIAQPDQVGWMVAINPGHGASILGVLLWPAILSVNGRLRWPVLVALIAFGAFLCTQFETYTNIAAFLISGLVALLAMRWPRATLMGLGILVSVAVLFAPLIALLAPMPEQMPLPHSWEERLAMWRSSAARIEQAPLFGTGLDSVRLMKTPTNISGVEYHFISLHPHNAGLQIWLELGGVGALIAAAAVFFGGRSASRALQGRAATAGAAGASVIATHLLLSLGVWQEWWIATAFVLAASVAALIDPEKRET